MAKAGHRVRVAWSPGNARGARCGQMRSSMRTSAAVSSSPSTAAWGARLTGESKRRGTVPDARPLRRTGDAAMDGTQAVACGSPGAVRLGARGSACGGLARAGVASCQPHPTRRPGRCPACPRARLPFCARCEKSRFVTASTVETTDGFRRSGSARGPMNHNRVTEVELKLAGDADALATVFREAGGVDSDATRIVSTYYDTADRRLWGRGFTFRLRSRESGTN